MTLLHTPQFPRNPQVVCRAGSLNINRIPVPSLDSRPGDWTQCIPCASRLPAGFPHNQNELEQGTNHKLVGQVHGALHHLAIHIHGSLFRDVTLSKPTRRRVCEPNSTLCGTYHITLLMLGSHRHAQAISPANPKGNRDTAGSGHSRRKIGGIRIGLNRNTQTASSRPNQRH